MKAVEKALVKLKSIEAGDLVAAKTAHGSLRKIGTQLDQTFCGDGKNKTWIFSFGRQ
jgi:hypothetical protein